MSAASCRRSRSATREKELQDRIAESRRVFGERNRIIQEASQYVMAQIDRAVEMVTQQVAISRGINLVLNRAQILGDDQRFRPDARGGGGPEQGACSGGDPAGRRLAGGDAGQRKAPRHGQRAAAADTAGQAAAPPQAAARRSNSAGEPAPGSGRWTGRRSPAIRASSAAAGRIAWPRWPMRREAEAPPRRLMLTGVAPLQTAEPSEVSFLDNRKYAAALAETRAGAVIVHPDMADRVPPTAVAIVADRALCRLGTRGGAVPSAAAGAARRASLRGGRAGCRDRCRAPRSGRWP